MLLQAFFFGGEGGLSHVLPWTRHKEGQDRRLQLEGDFCSEEDRTRGPTAKGASFKRFTMRKHYRAKGAVPLSETVLTIADCSAVPLLAAPASKVGCRQQVIMQPSSILTEEGCWGCRRCFYPNSHVSSEALAAGNPGFLRALELNRPQALHRPRVDTRLTGFWLKKLAEHGRLPRPGSQLSGFL